VPKPKEKLIPPPAPPALHPTLFEISQPPPPPVAYTTVKRHARRVKPATDGAHDDGPPIIKRSRQDSPTYRKRYAAFMAFDANHPEVWERFVSMAKQVRDTGAKKYSARTIIEVMRWHYTVNERRDGGFKINDHYSPFYVRKLIDVHPIYRNFFELRGEDDDGE
jgi:hypothetical protein